MFQATEWPSTTIGTVKPSATAQTLKIYYRYAQIRCSHLLLLLRSIREDGKASFNGGQYLRLAWDPVDLWPSMASPHLGKTGTCTHQQTLACY